MILNTIGLHITDKCNLMCAGCDHFVPLYKTRNHFDYKLFVNHLKRFNSIVGDNEVNNIHIVGGEPLLHPELLNLCKELRYILPIAGIAIKTNGTLLHKMPKVFYDVCQEYNIEIMLSDYHIINDSLRRIYRTKRNKVRTYREKEFFNFHYIADKKLNTVDVCPYEPSWDMAVHQITYDGNFYHCMYPANIDRYDTFYGCKHEVIEGKDYLNLYKTSKEEIINFINNSHPFCSYCMPPIKKKWHKYNKSNEWKYEENISDI